LRELRKRFRYGANPHRQRRKEKKNYVYPHHQLELEIRKRIVSGGKEGSEKNHVLCLCFSAFISMIYVAH